MQPKKGLDKSRYNSALLIKSVMRAEKQIMEEIVGLQI